MTNTTIIAYASSKEWRRNQLLSKAQYDSALPKNRVDFDIPLIAAPKVDVCAEMHAICSNCGGTGDVHRADGEWLGACDCAAPPAQGLPAAPKSLEAQSMELMADCMAMVHGDLIEAGIIDKSVPPMMVTEAVIRFIERDRAERAPAAAPSEQAEYDDNAEWTRKLQREAAQSLLLAGAGDAPKTAETRMDTGFHAGAGAAPSEPVARPILYVRQSDLDNLKPSHGVLASVRAEHVWSVPLFATPPAQDAGTGADVEEGAEILDTLIDSIEKHGNYSAEATLTFLHQIKQCIANSGRTE